MLLLKDTIQTLMSQQHNGRVYQLGDVVHLTNGLKQGYWLNFTRGWQAASSDNISNAKSYGEITILPNTTTGGGTNDDIICLLPVPDCNQDQEPLMIDLGQDGIIDAQDAIWMNLLLWNDLNADGTSSADELILLNTSGITQLQTSAKANARLDPAGNALRLWAWATNTNALGNNRYKMVDVFFAPLSQKP